MNQYVKKNQNDLEIMLQFDYCSDNSLASELGTFDDFLGKIIIYAYKIP